MLLLALALPCAHIAVHQGDAPAQPDEGAPPAGTSTWPSIVGIRVSPDTTHFTGPLDSKGDVDFVAALNGHFSEGATTENNALIPLLQAAGPSAVDDEHRDAVYRALGVKPLPKEGRYFTPFGPLFDDMVQSEIRERTTAAEESGAKPPDRWELENAIDERIRKDLSRPWRAADYPHVSKWLAENERPLQFVAESVERSRCYIPIVDAMLPNRIAPVVEFRQGIDLGVPLNLAEALCIRAMLHHGEGRQDAAWSDALTCVRLGKQWGEHHSPIDVMVGQFVSARGRETIRVLLDEAALTSERARRLLAELGDESTWPAFADFAGDMSRCSTLAVFPLAARYGFRPLLDKYGIRPVGDAYYVSELRETSQTRLEAFAARCFVDWEIAARVASRRCDEVCRACSLTTRNQRETAFAKLFPEKARNEGSPPPPVTRANLMRWVTPIFFDCFSRRRMYAHLIARYVADNGIGVAALACELGTYEQHMLNLRLPQLGLALAAFRHDRGEFPASLDALAPGYLKSVPLDPFTDKPFHYRRDGAGYLLYSVGENGKDDGGRTRWNSARCEDEEAPPNADDIAFRIVGKAIESRPDPGK